MSLTNKILLCLILGFIAGIILKPFMNENFVSNIIVGNIFDLGGKLFISLLRMIVIPVVFVSLVCGTSNIRSSGNIGVIAAKTIAMFLFTTAVAVSLGVFFSILFKVGATINVDSLSQTAVVTKQAISFSLKDFLISLVPINPVKAMADGNILQVIVFAILFGTAISFGGAASQNIINFFKELNHAVMALVKFIMNYAPIGVFCLIAKVTAETGLTLIENLLIYVLVIFLVLAIYFFGAFSLYLSILGKLNPIKFYKKILPVLMFAFSTASSNATIPVNLETTEEKLGVDKTLASFIIPFGAAVNLNGTAIMQGVAAIFIANVYHIPITTQMIISIIIASTITCFSTVGMPSMGVITLAAVLQQAGLPISGIGFILGIDRIIDMVRTPVNASGSSMVACVVARSEKLLDLDKYNN